MQKKKKKFFARFPPLYPPQPRKEIKRKTLLHVTTSCSLEYETAYTCARTH